MATRAKTAVILYRFVEIIINPTTAQCWIKNDYGHWCYYKYGKKLTGWQIIDGLRYYFNADSVMHKGWKEDSTTDNWYYWTNTGAVTGWKEISGKKYYFDSNGIMYIGEWKEIERRWYYFNADGTLTINIEESRNKTVPDGTKINP